MKEKQYDPAGNNEKAPQKGMASVDTFNEGESKKVRDENGEEDTVNDEDLIKEDEPVK